MSYGLYLKGKIIDFYGNVINVMVYKYNYSGNVVPINISTLKIDVKTNDNIISKLLDIEIINNISYSLYDELFTSYDKEIKAIVEKDGKTLFEGYLVTDLNEQQLLFPTVVRLSFNDYLVRLKDIRLNFIESKDYYCIFDYIRQAIYEIYEDRFNNLYIHSRLCCSYDEDVLEFFTSTLLFSESFYNSNNDEPETAWDVINKLLKPLNCYLYIHEDKLIIERLDDVLDEDYWVSINMSMPQIKDYTSALNQTLRANEDYKYIDESQLIQYNAAIRTLEVSVENKQFSNIIDPYFTIWYKLDEDHMTDIDPNYRTWKMHQIYWSQPGYGKECNIDVHPWGGKYTIQIMEGRKIKSSLYVNNPIFLMLLPIGYPYFLEDDINYGNNVWYKKLFGAYTKTGLLKVNTDEDAKIRYTGMFRVLDNVYFRVYNEEYLVEEINTTWDYYLNFTFAVLLNNNINNIYWVYRDENNDWSYSQSLTEHYEKISGQKLKQGDIIGRGETWNKFDIEIPIAEILKDIIGEEQETLITMRIGMHFMTKRPQDEHICFFNIIYGDLQLKYESGISENKYIYSINEMFYNTQSEELAINDAYDSSIMNGLYYNHYGTLKAIDGNIMEVGQSTLRLPDMYAMSILRQKCYTTKNLRASIITDKNIKPLGILKDSNIKRGNNEANQIIMSYSLDLMSNIYNIECSELINETIIINEA